MQKNKVGPHTKINSKWITDLNVNDKTVTLLKEFIGINLSNLGLGNAFLGTIPKAQVTKEQNR